ncbi:MAG: DUF559 domain-containing protein [Prevotella sp.]|jgi:very-short-patch-repair endonuclease|nr:DUF559 domain-containing protein [Prevotella sp.]
MKTYVRKCANCDIRIEENVYKYSKEKIGYSLCRNCQDWYKNLDRTVTDKAINLYFELKNRGIKAELEKFDGYKHIDIAIVSARLNIEIDGKQHNTQTEQALSDLKRTYYSFMKGYYTIRIPNSIAYNKELIKETADYIEEMVNHSKTTAKLR